MKKFDKVWMVQNECLEREEAFWTKKREDDLLTERIEGVDTLAHGQM